MTDRFAWLTISSDEVIGPDHPAWDQYEHERLLFEEPEELARLVAESTAKEEPPSLPRQPQRPQVPAVALALSPAAAAESLGVSLDFFDKRVKPQLRVVMEGRRILVPVRELERYLDERAARALRGR